MIRALPLARLGAAAGAGVLTVVALSPRPLGWVAWMALVPLLVALAGATRRTTVGVAIVYTVTFALLGLEPWFARSTAAYFDASLARMIVFTALPLTVLAVAHGAVLGAALLARPPLSGPLDVLWCAALWPCWEFLRTLVLPYYPAAVIGLTQHATIPVLQVASLTGVAGISFVVVAFNVGTAALLSAARPGRRALAAFTGLALAAGSAGWGMLRARSADGVAADGPRIVAVDIDAGDRAASTLDRYLVASAEAAALAPAMIVWPESALTTDVEHDRSAWAALSGFVAQTHTSLLAGGPASAVRMRGDVAHYNAAHLLTPGTGMRSYYKRGLVPVAERWSGIATALLGEPPADLVGLDAGREATVFPLDHAFFGVLICFEITSASGARALAAGGARFLVNLTNDVWFARCGQAPHLPWAAIRAVETGLPVIRAANAGVSVLFDPFGRPTAVRRPGDGGGLLAVRMPEPARTVYARAGDVFLVGCLAVVLAGVVAAGRSRRVPTAAGTRCRRHRGPSS